MRIDAHHHLWNLQDVHYPWLMEKGIKRFFGDPQPIQRNYLIDEFAASARESGFHASVHVQVGAESGYEEARWIQEVADASPDWPMVQVAFCDLTSKHAESELLRLRQLSTVVGIRQIVGRSQAEDSRSGTHTLVSSSAFKNGLRIVEQLGLSFDLQLVPSLFDSVIELFSDLPELEVVLCHAGSPTSHQGKDFDDWKRGIARFAARPKTLCKISGLPMFFGRPNRDTFDPVIKCCLSAFGPKRCMFGSNFPVDSLYASYSELMQAYETCVPTSFHNDVFGQTAHAFYFDRRQRFQ